MTAATLDDLRSDLGGRGPAYAAKQLHPARLDAPVVDRADFILAQCVGKVVLDIGASGPMHLAIQKVARDYWGIDHPANRPASALVRPGVFYVDLDQEHGALPNRNDARPFEVVVCGEVLEHLSNPGRFLDRLRAAYGATPVVVTVPNAFNAINQRTVRQGTENCNRDHVAWHSPRTIQTMLERAGYGITYFAWYGGEPGFSEGMALIAG